MQNIGLAHKRLTAAEESALVVKLDGEFLAAGLASQAYRDVGVANELAISPRTVRRRRTAAEVIGAVHLHDLKGTSLDTECEREALWSFADAARADLIARACAGEVVSAKAIVDQKRAREDALMRGSQSAVTKKQIAHRKHWLKLSADEQSAEADWIINIGLQRRKIEALAAFESMPLDLNYVRALNQFDQEMGG